MRAHGSLSTIPGAGTSDHLCWIHDGEDDAAFDGAVRTFLAGGLARGERLLCVGERVIAAARADVAPLTGVDALVGAGRLVLLTTSEAYANTGEFSADRSLAFYDAATREALADGCTGLRVVAEVTPLATDPQRRLELVRWEHLADRYVVHGSGMTAMCAYRRDLPPEALADVTAVHPAGHAPEGLSQFRVFFDDDRVVVAGSVDTFEAERLARVLEESPTDPAPVLDLSLLEFVDVAGCRVIALWAGRRRARGVPVEIRGASRMFRRVWSVLALSDVAPVAFAEVAA